MKETRIRHQEVFDDVYPALHGGFRAAKSFLAPALGCPVPEENQRSLQ